MARGIVLVIVMFLLVAGLSGCVGEKTESIAPPTAKYHASINSITDVTDNYPELAKKTVGWYDPTATRQVLRYLDSTPGMTKKHVQVLLVTQSSETEIRLETTGLRLDLYRIVGGGQTSLRSFSKAHPPGVGQVYAIEIVYDTPLKEELTGLDGIDLYSNEIGQWFAIRFVDPQTFKEGFS